MRTLGDKKPTNLAECDETGCLDCTYLKIHSRPGCFGSSITMMDKSRNHYGLSKCRQRQIFEHDYYVSLSTKKEMTYDERIAKLKELMDKYPVIEKCIEISKIVDRLGKPMGDLCGDSVEDSFDKLEKLLELIDKGKDKL